jgi:Flp pilus assembly protein TadG
MTRRNVQTRNVRMKRTRQEESGNVMVAFALFLFVLLGFCGLGMEAGRWYMVRAELSKSADAGALVAAKNISNPAFPRTSDVENLAEEFAAANFPSGYLGTPGSGAPGTVEFKATVDPSGSGKVQVDGNVSATAILAGLFGAGLVPTSTVGVAQKKEVEIMLVLDRSGSMGMGHPVPMDQLKAAASSFVDFFETTQETDKMGLISFSTAVTLDRPLGTDYVTDMKHAISHMSASDYTNTEDALDRADGPGGFTDQTHVSGDRRVQQFLIFFSDGQPTAFRGRFRFRGADYDAVAVGATVSNTGDCNPDTYPPNGNLYHPVTGATLTPTTRPTGDGTTTRVRCGGGSAVYTTRWYIFDTMPVPGYGATEACIPNHPLGEQFCYIANQLALDHAAELKARHIIIYTIGLGNIDAPFMQAIANPNLYYRAPDATQLRAIFQRVAQEIKLRLVQ